MRRIAGKILGVLLCVAVLGGACFGQNTTGTISGTVFDSKGAVVPNVKVTVTNLDQQIVVRTITTDDHGEYVERQDEVRERDGLDEHRRAADQ